MIRVVIAVDRNVFIGGKLDGKPTLIYHSHTCILMCRGLSK
jgi:hypothetical protein